MAVLDQLAERFAAIPIDRELCKQGDLDLVERNQLSVFPWRGQFSPGLVELLLNIHGDNESVVLDPFVGSGTTLFECARRGIECYGIEVNPAAAALAGMARFAPLAQQARSVILERARALLERHIAGHLPPSLFQAPVPRRDVETSLADLLGECTDDPLVHTVVVTSLMMAMGDGVTVDPARLYEHFELAAALAAKMPYSPRPCEVSLGDARDLQLPDKSVNLVITSPPYINVFNYHQNYRKAMELVGWDLLRVAPSEIGSNRKHRSNRFKTVLQYCMDMMQVLGELKRVLRTDGMVVCVVGRESRVRGMSFKNGQLLAMLAAGGGGFEVARRQERKFTNRFGALIYEDLLTLELGGPTVVDAEGFGRQVGAWALTQATRDAPDALRCDIAEAIREAPLVKPSPLQPSRPYGGEPRSVLQVEHAR